LVHSQARHGDRHSGVRHRNGNSSRRALNPVANRDLWLARRLSCSRGRVGVRDRAFELFLSMPKAGRDES
jgi:hypothetical protein